MEFQHTFSLCYRMGFYFAVLHTRPFALELRPFLYQLKNFPLLSNQLFPCAHLMPELVIFYCSLDILDESPPFHLILPCYFLN